MNEKMVRNMVASIACKSCGKRYQPQSVELLGNRDGVWFIRVVCSSCHVTVYIAAIIRDDRPQFFTDLTEDDMKRFKDMEPVSSEDLMSVRAFLEDFSGDFQDLFNG